MLLRLFIIIEIIIDCLDVTDNILMMLSIAIIITAAVIMVIAVVIVVIALVVVIVAIITRRC